MHVFWKGLCIFVLSKHEAVYADGDAELEQTRASATDIAESEETVRAHDEEMRATSSEESEETIRAHEEEMGMTYVIEPLEDDVSNEEEDSSEISQPDDTAEEESQHTSQPADRDEDDHRTLSAEEMSTLHDKIDQNSDGKISLSELLSFGDDMKRNTYTDDAMAVLHELDLDKDDRLSLEETLTDTDREGEALGEDSDDTRHMKDLQTAKFHVADKDGNGHLDREEATGFFFPEVDQDVLHLTVRSTMDRKDTDGDGYLSQEEFFEDEPQATDNQARFNHLDKDGDGRVNLHELAWWESRIFHAHEAMNKLLSISDTDMDGQVSKEELNAARQDLADDMRSNADVLGHDFQMDPQFYLKEWITRDL